MSQHQMILDFVRQNGSITPMDAFYHLGITKLSTRIGEMERRGIHFEHKPEPNVNRVGRPVIYMRYRLVDDGR